jgi:hypothetical protein
MNRTTLITLHMTLSAFFAPMVLLVAISGGLYLLGVKGSIAETPVYSAPDETLDPASDTLKADVEALLLRAGVEGFDFEYVKVSGATLYTRPTSRAHYAIETGAGVSVTRADPSLQKRLIELHMGHGPTAFKTFQKFFAAGLLFIILSGLWLGLSAQRLRSRTLGLALGGTVVFALLVL